MEACTPPNTGGTTGDASSSGGGEPSTSGVDPLTTSGGVFTLTSVTEGDPTSEGTTTATATTGPDETSTGEPDPCPALVDGLVAALAGGPHCELLLRIDGAGGILGWYAACGDVPAMPFDDKSAYQATQCCMDDGMLVSPDGESPFIYLQVPTPPLLGGVAIITNHIGEVVYDATIGVDEAGTISIPEELQAPSALGDGAGCSAGFELAATGYDLIAGGPLAGADVDLLTASIVATAVPAAIDQFGTIDRTLAIAYEAQFQKPGTTYLVLFELSAK